MKKFNLKKIKAKKKLGQHFLKDSGIAKKIVEALNINNLNSIIEIGPGMGILSDHLILLKKKRFLSKLIKILSSI